MGVVLELEEKRELDRRIKHDVAIVADRLGVDPHDVRFVNSDTAAVARGDSSHSHSGAEGSSEGRNGLGSCHDDGPLRHLATGGDRRRTASVLPMNILQARCPSPAVFAL